PAALAGRRRSFRVRQTPRRGPRPSPNLRTLPREREEPAQSRGRVRGRGPDPVPGLSAPDEERSTMLIEARCSALLTVDMQERLMPAMDGAEPVIANAARLLEAAGRLGVPILVSEQYPKGLGRTVPALAALAPTGAIAEKLHFSCAADPGWRARFEKLD